LFNPLFYLSFWDKKTEAVIHFGFPHFTLNSRISIDFHYAIALAAAVQALQLALPYCLRLLPE
jgi:hypothetical protein